MVARPSGQVRHHHKLCQTHSSRSMHGPASICVGCGPVREHQRPASVCPGSSRGVRNSQLLSQGLRVRGCENGCEHVKECERT